MDISGEYTFDAPQEVVWEALQDPDVLGSVMPGGQGVEEIGENEYAATLKIKVGPVQGVFKGTVKLSDIVAPESYRLEVEGKGAPGFMKGEGGMQLTGQGEKTHMRYQGVAQVGGRIATVGQRLIESSARSILDQSLNSLNEYLKVKVAGGPEAAEEVGQELEEATGTDAVAGAPETSVETEQPPAAALAAEPARPPAGESRREAPERAPQRPAAPQPPSAPPYEPPSMTKVAVNVARDVTNDLIPPHYRPVALAVGAFFLGILTARFSRR